MLDIIWSSFPENPLEFYKPLLDSLDSFIANSDLGRINAVFFIEYLNSSSSKIVMNIISKLDQYSKTGAKVSITWYHEPDDEDMQEFGEELQESTDVEMKIAEYQM